MIDFFAAHPGLFFLVLWFGSLFVLTALVSRFWPGSPAGTERGLPTEIETSRMRWRDR